MKMTLTDFQRDFRKAREAADRGHSIQILDNAGVEYVFERCLPEHPLKGLEHLFGTVTAPKDGLTAKERIRRRLNEKYGRG